MDQMPQGMPRWARFANQLGINVYHETDPDGTDVWELGRVVDQPFLLHFLFDAFLVAMLAAALFSRCR